MSEPKSSGSRNSAAISSRQPNHDDAPEAVDVAGLRRRLAEAEAARASAEGALRRSEDDARFVLENIPQLVWRSRAEGAWTWGGPQWTAYTGQTDRQARGLGWLEAVHPEDREKTMLAWDAASGPDGGDLAVEHRVRRAADGAYRWFQTRAVPRHDRSGAREWFGTSTDVDDLKTLQEREAALLDALRTRVRASLATVRGLVRRLGETGDGAEDFAAQLGGRLDALGRVQNALIRDPFGGIDLGTLAADELRAGGPHGGRRSRVEGPQTLLLPRTAETVALALHELAANAAKFGAFGRRSGHVSVTWRFEAGGGAGAASPRRLRLEWSEAVCPADVGPPRRRGFGLGWLERTLPRELGAEVALTFDPGGLVCSIALPVACCVPSDA